MGFFIHLCRDYHFSLFKLDGVCGRLRPEKAGVFAKMLQTCRKYSPDLIVLNHRLDLYEGEPYVTTFLWNGSETYTDILSANAVTAMHNRAYMFSRGHVPELSRLAEDHGVCISSAVDYFEDELIYQAFNRSLILAPEIYGNPWLLRDDELPKLARIYNLHRRNAAILVDGMVLPQKITAIGEYSCDLAYWNAARLEEMSTWQENASIPVVTFTKHTIYEAKGRLLRAVYPIRGALRYFRLTEPMDRIHHFRVLKDGKLLSFENPHGNNMQAHYSKRPTRTLKSGTLQLPEDCRNAFLAVAIEGEHGDEGVYCCACFDGTYLAPNQRAPDFKANVWEHKVMEAWKNTTSYIPLPAEAAGKQVTVYATFSQWDTDQIPCRVYLCRNH